MSLKRNVLEKKTYGDIVAIGLTYSVEYMYRE